MRTSGLYFRKFDLHVHTPASKCFPDKNVTPVQIVDHCIQAGLSAIAITDHNTGEWVDKVKTAAKGKDLTVFPGVEVTTGDAHIHIIAILDIDKKTRDIEDLLVTLGILSGDFGKKDTFSSKSVTEAIELISGDMFNGLAMPAHIDSTNGVFTEMGGTEREEVIQCSKLLAIEAVNYQKVSKRLKEYKSKLAVYQSSDNPYLDKTGQPMVTGPHSGNHSIDGIGFRCSHFKVDERITLESLRQCFVDPDVRIRQSSEYREEICSYIRSVKVKGGFLSDEELVLHCGLNSILGGKGVGKSLIVEFMRFALDQESLIPSIIEDHRGKLSERLGEYGRVEIIISDETGREFQITRTYDPSQNSPIECKYLSTGETIDGNVTQRFPVLFLSQMEIIRMAEDPDAQMRFIDQFFDFQRFLNQIEDIETMLEKFDGELTESIEACKIRTMLNERLQTAQIESGLLLEQLQNPIFDEYSKWENKDKAFRTYYGFLETLRGHVNAFKGTIEHEEIPEIPRELSLLFSMDMEFQVGLDNGIFSEQLRQQFKYNNIALPQNATILIEKEYSSWAIKNEDERIYYIVKKKDDVLNTYELSQEPALERTECYLRNAQISLIDSSAAQQAGLSETLDKIQGEYETWKTVFDKKKAEYQEEVLKLGGDTQKLEEKRRIKVEEIEDIERKLFAVDNKARRLEEIIDARNEKLEELREIYSIYFQARKEKCEYFEKSSNGRLQINIIESTSRDEFKECLLSLKKGSHLREPDIERICSKIEPGEFVHNIVLYDIAHFCATEDPGKYIKSIAQKTDLAEDKIKTLADHLLNTKKYDEILPLQYKAHPQDRPDIKYNVGDDSTPIFKPLKDLSTGQKCTAMIILALSEGTMPIVIDQPEDSLDIRTIWDDMCLKLRAGKETRQFIFTTHNSSIAVASDTDKFTIMTASAEKGEIVFSGAIDDEHVKHEVIKYLEGGKRTYELKYSKYNILK